MKRICLAAWLVAACIVIMAPLGARAQAPQTNPPPTAPAGGTGGTQAAAPSGTTQPSTPAGSPQAGSPTDAAPLATPAGGASAPIAASPQPAPAPSRASWLSDRAPLRVGDLLTVVIDEQTTARESISRTASADRTTLANMKADANGKSAIGSTGISTDMGGKSRDIGEANREGDLLATLGVRVTSVDEAGNAKIEGTKKVVVDGRDQEITLQGTIRPQDVPPSNVIHSSRIADASFGYKGKDIGPRKSFLGRILSMLWP